EAVVRLDLDHGPHGDAHRGERLLQWIELRPERRLDAGARLVAGPQIVAERFDHMVGRDTDVRTTRLDRLQHSGQHPDHRPEWRVLAVRESANAVEVSKQLVRAVDQVNEHDDLMLSSPSPLDNIAGGQLQIPRRFTPRDDVWLLTCWISRSDRTS